MRFPGTRTLSFAYFFAAVLTGFLLSMGFPGTTFPTISLGFIIPVAFFPLFFAMEMLPTGRVSQGRTARHDYTVTAFGRGRDAFLLCWMAGALLNSIAFFWTTKPAILFGGFPPALAYALFALYCVLSGLFLPIVLSPFILNIARGAKKFQKPLSVFSLAVLSTLIEHYCPRFFFWTFGSLMHSVPAVNQWSSVLGFSGASLFVFLTSGYLARTLATTPRNPGQIVTTIGSLGIFWIFIISMGSWRINSVDKELELAPRTRIGFIQPNFTFNELSSNPNRDVQSQDASIDTLLSKSQVVVDKAADKKLDLLVWPESVAPSLFAVNPLQIGAVKEFSKKNDVPILVQAIEFDQKDLDTNGYRRATAYSVSFLIRPDGSRSKSYRKWVPIPFGESVPFENTFPFLGNFIRDRVGNTSKVGIGTNFEALAYNPLYRVGTLICFDSIDPDLSRLETQKGKASFFVNQSNFVWMGNSNAGYAFRELNRFRALENSRSVLMIANTGPSAGFDPLGRPLFPDTDLLKATDGIVEVPISTENTFYSRAGNLILLLLGILALVRLAFTGNKSVSRRLR